MFLLIPLYTRIKKEEALEHFVRGRIFQLIEDTPGENYTSIKETLRLSDGTLIYHLKVLEMQGFVKHRRVGLFKQFYPQDYRLELREEGTEKFSPMQSEVLDAIRESPGVSQLELRAIFKGSQQQISYNLKVLERNGIIRSEREGRRVRYYPINRDT